MLNETEGDSDRGRSVLSIIFMDRLEDWLGNLFSKNTLIETTMNSMLVNVTSNFRNLKKESRFSELTPGK